MKIGIDISPLKSGHYLQHRVRGTGFYLKNLKEALLKLSIKDSLAFFDRSGKMPGDAEIIHIPYFEPFFLTLPIIKKHKTVVTVHDLTPLVFSKNFPSGIKGKLKWNIQKFLLRRCDGVITDSESSKRDIVQYTGISANKISVVYLAAGKEFKKLEIGNWKLEIVKKYGLPDRFILYVGDVTWNKNLPAIIAAAKKADLPLVMVGKALVEEDFDRSNPWNQDLAKVQDMVSNQQPIRQAQGRSATNSTGSGQISNQIIKLGFVSTEDLIKLYNLATVFVIPSLYEGFGLPVLEAMASGCPVITSKEGSLPEVAGDAAFYVDAYNVDSIAEGIKKVFNDSKLRENLSERGIRHAKKFSWEKTAFQTRRVYERVLK